MSWVDVQADLTLAALKARLLTEFNISITEKTVSLWLTKAGFTFKLMRVLPISRNTPEAIDARRQYATMFLNDAPADRNDVIWVDESGFNLHLRRRHGRAISGHRAAVVVANSRGRNISICAAMSGDGFIHHLQQFGGFNSDLFCDFLTSLFAILHARGRVNCWIVLDNVRFHHCANVANTAARAGHRLIFLPTYSPMLNPIESLFGKWKIGVRTQ